ncbi:MAG: polysaccharide deacetylase family protein [Anaerolineales bacterium]|jgi:peptidoglycan/xylan/chitin deacetylase (PgdA/CDA1 family)
MLYKRIYLGLLVISTSVLVSMLSNSDARADSMGSVTVPILLYHSIPDQSSPNERYKVSAENFNQQMRQLHEWGYSTISIETLVAHLAQGDSLPPRPIVITFDDGYQDIFENAFPIMERYGFSGTVYIVANRLNSDGFMHREELQELLDHGWEVGSHSMTHTELTQNHDLVRTEVLQSRLDLNDALGIKVFSFAYPFGTLDWYITSKVLDYGYRAAVGVGNLSQHSAGTIYNLSRREVQGDASMQDFIDLLPWSGHFSPAPIRKYRFD